MDSVESLLLTVYQKHVQCYKFLKFLIQIKFLGQPTFIAYAVTRGMTYAWFSLRANKLGPTFRACCA